MDCTTLTTITGWDCVPAGRNSIKAIAPFSFGNAGERIVFYIAQPSPGSYFLTDASETAMMAEQHGAILTKSRVESLNHTYGCENAEFQQDWSIESSGPMSELQEALWSGVKLAFALSFKTSRWQPKFAQAKFQAIVFRELQAQLGAERVIRNAKVQGASGHWVEFPMSVRSSRGTDLYIQPVALDNGKVSWPAVYEAQGKLFDVKVASEVENRIAILEDGPKSAEFGRAASFIGHTAKVFTLRGIRDWERAFA